MYPRRDAELLCRFVNTRLIHEDDGKAREDLATVTQLRDWWRDQGHPARGLHSDDVDEAQSLREGLRALMATHNDATAEVDEQARDRLDALVAGLRFGGQSVEDGLGVVPEDAERPGRRALGRLVLAVTRAGAEGTWERFKVCRNPQCRYAFLDTTRNRSRAWCSMQLCGGRAKQHAFAERHRRDQEGGPPR